MADTVVTCKYCNALKPAKRVGHVEAVWAWASTLLHRNARMARPARGVDR